MTPAIDDGRQAVTERRRTRVQRAIAAARREGSALSVAAIGRAAGGSLRIIAKPQVRMSFQLGPRTALLEFGNAWGVFAGQASSSACLMGQCSWPPRCGFLR